MIGFLEDLGLAILSFFELIGGMINLLFETVGWMVTGAPRMALMVNQMSILGINSLPIVFITVGFGGMVLSLELAYQAVKFGFMRWVGAGVSIAMAREFAPMLTAIVFSGRAGSAITAELGSMKVTEQIDALEAMATSPVSYLVVPRFISCLCMVPVLTVFGNVAGIFGGAFVANVNANVPYNVFFDSIKSNLAWHDVYGGLIKAIIFGGEIAMIACYQGLRTRGGAAGVGLSTTSSVVNSIIIVFISNYFLSTFLFPS